jgi:hypothetical protein
MPTRLRIRVIAISRTVWAFSPASIARRLVPTAQVARMMRPQARAFEL